MEKKQVLQILAASTAAVALQGCVAAIVPIAAGGLMTQSRERDSAEAPAQVEPVESAPAPVAAAPEPSPEVQAAIAESAAEIAPAAPEAAPELEPQPEPAAPATQEVPASVEPVPVQPAPAEPVTEAPAPSIVEAPTTSDLPGIAAEFDEPAPEEPAAVLVASLPEEPAPIPVPTPAPTPEPAATSEVEAAAEASAPVETAAPIEVAEVEAPAAESVAAPAPAPAPEAAPTPAPPTRPAAPSPSNSPSTVPSPMVATLFDPLVNYATAPEFASGQEGRISAMLRDATSLRPTRVDCAGDVPTVLIDLDPDGEDLNVSEPLSAPSALGVKLAQMRAQGIAIAWISRKSRDSENAIRAALTRSGLDLSGGDQLLLMGGPDDRKQTLRNGLAGTSCLVAIAGDTRADFHELFDYLLNPDDAYSLQPMIGNGWFIIPTPLLPERP